MKKLSLYFLTAMMVLSLSACGNDEAVSTNGEVSSSGTKEIVESVSTETVTEAPASEPIEAPTEVPTEAPTPEPTEAPTPEPTEVPTPEPTEAPTPEPTEAPTPEPTEAPTPEPTAVPTPEPTEAPAPEPTPEPTVAPTPVPTVAPNPVTPSAGENLNYNNSITLPSGAKLPVLNEFNTAGLDPNNCFWGDWSSQIVADNFETYINALEDVENTWGSSADAGQNFAYSANSMQFYLGSFSNYSDIEIRRDSSEYYTLVINMPLNTTWASQNNFTLSDAACNRANEALVAILACVSSTPMEIKNEVCTLLYDTTTTSKIPLDGGWANIGDAKVRLSSYNFENGEHIVFFHIKGK